MNAHVTLHIEELVLHGFPPGAQRHIGAAMEHELTRLFTERGVPPALLRGGAIPQLDGGAVTFAPGVKPDAIGVQVARAVYGGLR